MKRLSTPTCIGLILSAALTFAGRMVAQEQNQPDRAHHYTVIDLGTLGGTFAQANSINNKRQVTGYSTMPGDQNEHAFLWANGVMTDLGTLGGPNSIGNRINSYGAVAGHSDTSTPDPSGALPCPYGTGLICRGVVWQSGVMFPLSTLGGKNSWSYAINDRFQVPGSAETLIPDTTCQSQQVLQMKPVVWERGKIHELPTFSGDPDGGVTGINVGGQAVGFSGDCPLLSSPTFFHHALLWERGTVTDLGNLGGSSFNVPQSINNRGQVVGFSDLPGDTTSHAFLWENGVMSDLGAMSGDTTSEAFSIDAGSDEKPHVVGTSCDVNFNCRAVLWRGGLITDLNTLIPAESSLYLLVAFGINDRGDIAGEALQTSTGEIHGFLAIPKEDKSGEESDAHVPQSDNGARPAVALPESVRKLVRQHLPFHRL